MTLYLFIAFLTIYKMASQIILPEYRLRLSVHFSTSDSDGGFERTSILVKIKGAGILKPLYIDHM